MPQLICSCGFLNCKNIEENIKTDPGILQDIEYNNTGWVAP